MTTRGSYQTFMQAEDGSILYVTVKYIFYAIPCGDTDMDIHVYHYQSGEITEYITEVWMEKFEELAELDYKEKNDRYMHFLELTSDYHTGKHISAMYIVRMMQAGYNSDKIIDELSKLTDEIYVKYREYIEYGVPKIEIPIDWSKAPDWLKEKFDKKP